MSDEDDVIRLGRDPDRVPVPLRDVFPWWLLGGAVLQFALVLALSPFSPAGSGLILWGVVIGTTIRDRRALVRRLVAEGTPVTRRAIIGPRWLDPSMTGALVVLGVGLSLVIGNVIAIGEQVQWPPAIAGGMLVALGAAILLAIYLRARLKRPRKP